MGSKGEVPCQGFGDEIPIIPMCEALINKNRRGAEGDNYDSNTLRKSFLLDSNRLRAALGPEG